MNADLVQTLKLGLTPWLYRGLGASVRLNRIGAVPDGPCIFACLHRDMIPALLAVEPYRPALLVSRSLDGEVLIRTLEERGFSFIRGSTGKDGGSAFRALLHRLRDGGSVGIAVDGPRGPYGKIHEGVLRLALRTGAPIVPVVAVPGRHLALKTWDRTVVPAPWSTLDVHFGPSVTVVAGGERDAAGAVSDHLLDGAA